MNNMKRKKAEYLLSQIGEIDDAILQEAENYSVRAKRPNKFLLIAATLTLSFAVIIGSTVIGMMENNTTKPDGEDINQTPSVGETPNMPDTEYSLDNLLQVSQEAVGNYEVVNTTDELPCFDGKAHIVWQYDNTEEYYISSAISKSRLETIIKSINKGEQVGTKSPELVCKVWILLGDGRVITPYLVYAIGNVSTEIFDYEEELIPNDELVKCISEILT